MRHKFIDNYGKIGGEGMLNVTGRSGGIVVMWDKGYWRREVVADAN